MTSPASPTFSTTCKGKSSLLSHCLMKRSTRAAGSPSVRRSFMYGCDTRSRRMSALRAPGRQWMRFEPIVHKSVRSAYHQRTTASWRHLVKQSMCFNAARRPERTGIVRIKMPATRWDMPCRRSRKRREERSPIPWRCVCARAEDGIQHGTQPFTTHGIKDGVFLQCLQGGWTLHQPR